MEKIKVKMIRLEQLMVELGPRRISCYREVHEAHLFSADQKSSSRPIGNGGGSC
jgi:hypothetical protein